MFAGFAVRAGHCRLKQIMSSSRVEHSQWGGYIEYAVVTDVGMRRTTNQDAHSIVLASDEEAWARRGHLFVVADGMGAHAAGELASRMAADGIPNHYLKMRDVPPWEALRAAVEQANAEVHARGQANLDFFNMGTTASVLLLMPNGALISHVGDSRVYRLRGNRFEQLTFDHSLVWELQAAGHPTAGAPDSAIPKNIITRSLGPNPTVQVDLEGPFDLREGDVFLLCSDGLTGQVADEEIGTILSSLPLATAAEVLCDLANLRGGPDNITVILVRVLREPPATTVSQVATAGSRPVAVIPAWFWIAAASDVLLAVALAVLGMFLAAAILGGAAVLSLIGALLYRLTAGQSGGQLVRRLGKAPYRSVACQASRSLVQKFDTIVRQLQEAAAENFWKVDMDQFNVLVQQAAAAASDQDYDRALHCYARAIRCMIDGLQGPSETP